MKTSIQVTTGLKRKLDALKNTDASTYEDVLKGLLPEGVNPKNYTQINKETPAWEWTVGFVNNHDPDERLEVSWSELKDSETGDSWELEGSWDKYEATIIFKDRKGVLLRFGEQRYDDEKMDYWLEYFHFL